MFCVYYVWSKLDNGVDPHFTIDTHLSIICFFFKFQADSLSESDCWKKHLSTAFESKVDGTVNEAFSRMIERNGGDSSENSSGSANVADLVDAAPHDTSVNIDDTGKKFSSLLEKIKNKQPSLLSILQLLCNRKRVEVLI